jgi:thiol-disulfide isomerase/thioredoxin
MKFLTLPFIMLLANFCVGQTSIIKLPALEQIISDRQSEKVLVINFWATWCAPCVNELPLFENFQSSNKMNAKVTLISLDYADKVQKVNSFVIRKKLKSEVLLLDEIDGNIWIDKVEPTWGGAIPATLFIDPRTGHRKFIDKALKEGDLEKIVAELLSQRPIK